MFPTVLRSMLSNVLGGVWGQGRSGRGRKNSDSNNTNQLVAVVDECLTLDPHFKIDEQKCSLAPTLNWHLGCYGAIYKTLMTFPMVAQTIQRRDFCKRLVDNLCGEKANREMIEDDAKEDDRVLSVDLNFACSKRVCGSSYVCVMLCSHHLLAMCHIKHFNLAAAINGKGNEKRNKVQKNQHITDGTDSSPVTGDDSSHPLCSDSNDTVNAENISTNSNLIEDSEMKKWSSGIKLDGSSIDSKASDGSIDRDDESTKRQKVADTKPIPDLDAAPIESGGGDNTKMHEHLEIKDQTDEALLKSKDKSQKKDKTKKDINDKPNNQNKAPHNEGQAGTNINGHTALNGKRNGEGSKRTDSSADGKVTEDEEEENGSPLPTVVDQGEKLTNGGSGGSSGGAGHMPATPSNKESIVVRLSNKIKVSIDGV